MLEPEHLGLPATSASAETSSANGDVTSSVKSNGEMLTLAEMEKRHILAALDKCNGNRTHAAKLLDLSIRTLRNKLHEYNGTLPRSEDDTEVIEK
jgi:DNA-binding NtrC family response regulator